MKLQTVRVREFQSVWDSGPFNIDSVACLVGKNEAGKSALLQALYRLNPIVPGEGNFDITDDYPRAEVENYQQDVESGRRGHAVVIEASFELEASELQAVGELYGTEALSKPVVTVSKGYARNASDACTLFVNVPIVEDAIVRHLVASFALPERLASQINSTTTLTALAAALAGIGRKQTEEVAAAQAAAQQQSDDAERAAALEESKKLAESEQAKALRARLAELAKHEDLGIHIWQTLLKPSFPTFLYFSEYYRLRGHDNIEALKARKDAGKLEEPDHPLLGLIDLARIDLDRLLSQTRTQDLKNKLQGASNHLSTQILKYWSQNKHLRMLFDVRQALPGDPSGMQKGTNIWGEVYDAKHLVSTGLGTRSAGFVWFFSFLAWYSAVKKKDERLVLLLDEPGLSLHGKAQEDLLRYFEAEIVTNPKHQLIYSTHSPFMVDPKHFDRVRIVQDRGIDTDGPLPREEDGTKVFTDVLEAGPDSLFPLQGALGYEIYQTLFVGPNCLIVEGVSDLLYLQTMTAVLQGAGRDGLDGRWTITPVGGADKVPTFVALIGSQKRLNVATLIDFQRGDQQTIENLYKKQLLERSHVLTFADFVPAAEADIEDLFDVELYLDLVSREFARALPGPLAPSALTSRAPRILVRLQEYFAKNPLGAEMKFNHYRPARLLAEQLSTRSFPDGTLDRFEAVFRAVNKLL